jgi:secreted trypsin-like serine protease
LKEEEEESANMIRAFLVVLSFVVLAVAQEKPVIGDLYKFPTPPNFPADGEFVDGVPMEYKSENSTNWIVGIVGGVVVRDISEAPFIAALINSAGNQFCGGSYIGGQWILTAAHCVNAGTTYRVRLGSIISNSGGELLTTTGVTRHPNYNSVTLDNDAALLRLPGAPSNANVRPITRAPANSGDFSGQTATVAGWGATAESGGTVINLRKVDVPVVTNTECSRSYSRITATMICAGLWDGGKDACQGDSGGPMWVGNRQVGIVSWGTGCARRGYYGVYARVSQFDTWIRSVTGF